MSKCCQNRRYKVRVNTWVDIETNRKQFRKNRHNKYWQNPIANKLKQSKFHLPTEHTRSRPKLITCKTAIVLCTSLFLCRVPATVDRRLIRANGNHPRIHRFQSHAQLLKCVYDPGDYGKYLSYVHVYNNLSP